MRTLNRRLLWLIFSVIGGFVLVAVFVFSSLLLSAPYCRSWYGAPLEKTGAVSEGINDRSILYMNIINSRFCVISIDDNIKDSVFPDTSLRLTIGFFDRWWRLHTYPARVGGELSNGEQINLSICLNKEDGQRCSLYRNDEAFKILKGRNFVTGDIIYKDSAPWENAKQTAKYQDIFFRMRDALISGRKYPRNTKQNEDFVIQIWQIEI